MPASCTSHLRLGTLRYTSQYIPDCADHGGQRLFIANQEQHHFAKPLAPLTGKWWLGNYLFERHLRLQSRFFILPQVTSARREPAPLPPQIQAVPGRARPCYPSPLGEGMILPARQVAA